MSNVLLFDHSSSLFKLNHTKPPPRKITINHCSLSNIDFAAFLDDISLSLLFNEDCDDLSSLVTRYDQVLPLPKQKYGNDMEKLGPYMAHIWKWYGKDE